MGIKLSSPNALQGRSSHVTFFFYRNMGMFTGRREPPALGAAGSSPALLRSALLVGFQGVQGSRGLLGDAWLSNLKG